MQTRGRTGPTEKEQTGRAVREGQVDGWDRARDTLPNLVTPKKTKNPRADLKADALRMLLVQTFNREEEEKKKKKKKKKVREWLGMKYKPGGWRPVQDLCKREES
jgi:hypothetical protein